MRIPALKPRLAFKPALPASATAVALLLLLFDGCRFPGSQPQAGARIAVLAGGSGELETDNFFTRDFRELREKLLARRWKVRAAVGSRDRILPDSAAATNANLRRVIEGGVRDARRGDELLIVLHSHGRERERLWAQRSHSLVSEDRDPSGADPGFNLDSLEPLFVQARERGVRLALVDLSCYSGSTLVLHGPDCTATLAAPDYISICSGRPEERAFNSRFFQLPPPGTASDLTTQFLRARREDRESVNLPQLSSRPAVALSEWNDLLAGLDPLDVSGDVAAYRAGARPYDPTRFYRGLDAALARIPFAPQVRESLRHGVHDELARMLRLRALLEQAMPGMAGSYDQDTLQLKLPGPGFESPLPISPGNLADFLDKVSEERFDPARLDGYTQAQRDLMSRLRPERLRVERENAVALAAFRRRKDRYDEKVDELSAAAGRLFALERRLYDSQGALKADPCRDFQL